MKFFTAVTFQNDEHAELLQAWLYDFEPLGLLEGDEEWTAYFPADTWLEQIKPELDIWLAERFPETEYAFEAIEDQNWNEEYERSITPVDVNERITIAPSWSGAAFPPERMVVRIDPKMSFGTGLHATTRLMIRLLERHIHSGDTVLDIGTGTGVLLIIAEKLGAKQCLGVDIDEWSTSNAYENVALNGGSDAIEVRQGTIEQAEGRYDLILSNITKNDNIALLQHIKERLSPGGRIVLSGYLTGDASEIRYECERLGFAPLEYKQEDEWAAEAFHLAEEQ
ncbi:MAG: 50S ribosomal protein L11 methyltransferase [Ectothiorhodospiraceae bacterium]|nr:50S ribosomal protein L11 methyltransferase [Ectothiorhodospiraceae bacterium]